MKTYIRRSAERGHVDHGWLDTRHSFSFGTYHDPDHMGFGPLRVINQDRVQPGAGFPLHGHRDMEIVSYVLSGTLAHQDSTGTRGRIRPGDVQLMRAGRGIRHSEMNGSDSEGVHFLQIWIRPAHASSEPGYQQEHFSRDRRGAVLLVSPDGRECSLQIDQDVDLWRLLVDEGHQTSRTLRGRRAWVQVIAGELEVGDVALGPGDGLGVEGESDLVLRARGEVEALLFDLP